MNNYTMSCSAWTLHMRGPLVGPPRVYREYLKEASRCTIQEGADVTVDHVSNPVLEQSLTYLMQSLMRAAARAKTVGEVAEILLVDRLQQHRHGLGHDLVLQGRKP